MKLESKAVTGLMLTLLLTSMLSMAFIASAKAQDSVDSSTVGLWHLDEVLPNGYREITPGHWEQPGNFGGRTHDSYAR